MQRKKIIFILMLATIFGILTSCSTGINGYNHRYYAPNLGDDRGNCVLCIKYRCDKYCNACQSNEPICKPCWNCLESIGCKN